MAGLSKAPNGEMEQFIRMLGTAGWTPGNLKAVLKHQGVVDAMVRKGREMLRSGLDYSMAFRLDTTSTFSGPGEMLSMADIHIVDRDEICDANFPEHFRRDLGNLQDVTPKVNLLMRAHSWGLATVLEWMRKDDFYPLGLTELLLFAIAEPKQPYKEGCILALAVSDGMQHTPCFAKLSRLPDGSRELGVHYPGEEMPLDTSILVRAGEYPDPETFLARQPGGRRQRQQN